MASLWVHYCGFDPCPMPDGSGVKAMPGSIPPKSGSLQKNKKIQVAKLGTPKDIIFKESIIVFIKITCLNMSGFDFWN